MREMIVVAVIVGCLFMAATRTELTREATGREMPTERSFVNEETPKETPPPVVIERRIAVEAPSAPERPANVPVAPKEEVKEPVNYYAMGYSDEGNRLDRSHEVCQRYSACEQYEQGQRDRRYAR